MHYNGDPAAAAAAMAAHMASAGARLLRALAASVPAGQA